MTHMLMNYGTVQRHSLDEITALLDKPVNPEAPRPPDLATYVDVMHRNLSAWLLTYSPSIEKAEATVGDTSSVLHVMMNYLYMMADWLARANTLGTDGIDWANPAHIKQLHNEWFIGIEKAGVLVTAEMKEVAEKTPGLDPGAVPPIKGLPTVPGLPVLAWAERYKWLLAAGGVGLLGLLVLGGRR
jgi:hypothetical protein